MPGACNGFFCDPQMIAGVIVVSFLLVVAIVYLMVRMLPVNSARKRSGREPLPWREILRSRMRGADLAVAQEGGLSAEREHQRQLEWEKEQATHELVRTGTQIQRQFCKEHQRYCYHAFEEGHPSGGFDNPTVPDDWPPDLRDKR